MLRQSQYHTDNTNTRPRRESLLPGRKPWEADDHPTANPLLSSLVPAEIRGRGTATDIGLPCRWLFLERAIYHGYANARRIFLGIVKHVPQGRRVLYLLHKTRDKVWRWRWGENVGRIDAQGLSKQGRTPAFDCQASATHVPSMILPRWSLHKPRSDGTFLSFFFFLAHDQLCWKSTVRYHHHLPLLLPFLLRPLAVR